MTPETLGVVLTAFIAIGLVIGIATKDAIIVLYTSQVEGTRVHLDPTARVLVSIAIPLVLALLVAISITLNGVTKDAKLQKSQATAAAGQTSTATRDKLADLRDERAESERQRLEAQQAALAARQAAVNARFKADIDALRRDGAETRDTVLNLKRKAADGAPVVERKRVVVATRQVQRTGPSSTDTSVFGINSDGSLSLLFVAHLFEGTAYWAYDSKVTFETKDGTPYTDFVRDIETSSSLMREFEGHDYVIGVGLASRTQRKVPNIAKARARNLCGQLSALVGDRSSPQVLGLSIGDYTGSKRDTPAAPAREQRTALILGVRKNVAKDFSAVEIVDAILDTIGVPRIDLSAYDAFKPAGSLTWYAVSECGQGTTF